MKVLILKTYDEKTFSVIRNCFPAEWDVAACGAADSQAVENHLETADIIIPENSPVTGEMISMAPGLRVIQTGAGYDNVDLSCAAERGVAVGCAPGINSEDVAEHALAFIVSWFKRLHHLDRGMKEGRWPREKLGRSLKSLTVGIAGYGRIGSAAAGMSLALGMRVLVFSRRKLDSIVSGPAGNGRIVQVGKEELLMESDAVSLHLDLGPETTRFIGRNELGMMKKEALLVNTSRGALIDEEALTDALENRTIGGAALDVFENEPLPADSRLRKLDNVILTPHTAGVPDYIESYRKRFSFFHDNIVSILAGNGNAALANPGGTA